NKSTGVNRVQHRQCAATFERGHEKHHHRDVANYPSEKARVDNVTGEGAVCFFRAGFVEKLTKRTEKGSDDEEHDGERRRSHRSCERKRFRRSSANASSILTDH